MLAGRGSDHRRGPYHFAGRGRDQSAPVSPRHQLRHGFWFRSRHGSGRGPGLAVPPFTQPTGRLSLSSDYGGIDCQPLHVGVAGYSFKYPLEDTLLDPSIVSALGRLVRAKAICRQIAPTRTRTSEPQDRIKETSGIATRATLAFAAAGNKGSKPFPLIIPKNLASEH